MKFLIISFIIVILLVSCAQEEIKEAEISTLQEPILIINASKTRGLPSDYNKSFDRTVKLPLKIWPSYTQKFMAVAGPRGDTCVLEGEPTTMTPMADVEILEEASCLYTLFQEEGRAPGQYFVGITKVRIIDTGEIGWTWSNAIAK
tara:strand:- start:6705 stop:7142 length:438 start_codon:yes stop_codon:yes gene_type:complete